MSARCMICDWSPTNNKSLFNPEVSEVGYNRLELCPYTGDTLCGICAGSISKLNNAFKADSEISKYMIDKDVEALDVFAEDSDVKGSVRVYDSETNQFSGQRKSALRYD